jgi:hypothetical protein
MPKRTNDIEAQHRKLCYRDFAYYAARNLYIRPKEGDLRAFNLNKAQQYVHDRLEEQKARTGKVRALILKGRQQGMSTYIEGRFFWNTTKRKGVRAFILAHESDSTSSLFTMAKRYYDNCPIPMRPQIQTSNAKELIFSDIDSGYKIGTAGNESVGRSQTNQYFHGSEVAFWKNTSELVKGVLQTVPDMEETEVIYESTANGVGNFFHQQCIAAMKGEGEYQFIFVPWYWQDEYVKKVPDDFARTELERGLIDLYGDNGLTDANLVWRRNKIIELSTDGNDGLKAFKQEYPCDPHEAFQVTGDNGLISPESVMKARKATNVNQNGPLIVGVDPSRGGDRFAVARRRQRVVYDIEAHTGDINLGRAVQICKKILDNENPAMMFVDAGGGADLVDRLHELGYHRVVRAVPFGGKALDPDKYKNKRAEMWGLVREWLNDESLDVMLPDEDAIQSDLCTPMYERDSIDRIVLESKDKIKKRGLPSPDFGDAIALTFAEPVRTADMRRPTVKRSV